MRRVKSFLIADKDIIRFLRLQSHLARGVTHISVPRIDAVPEDANIIRVGYNPCHMAFEVIVEHPSFEPVELCDEVPRTKGAFMMVTRKIKYLDDNQPTNNTKKGVDF